MKKPEVYLNWSSCLLMTINGTVPYVILHQMFFDLLSDDILKELLSDENIAITLETREVVSKPPMFIRDDVTNASIVIITQKMFDAVLLKDIADSVKRVLTKQGYEVL